MNGYYEGCTYGGNTPVDGRIGYPVFHTIDSGGSAMLCANFSRRIDPDEFPGYHAIHNFVETISSPDDCNQPWSNSKDHAASCDGLGSYGCYREEAANYQSIGLYRNPPRTSSLVEERVKYFWWILLIDICAAVTTYGLLRLFERCPCRRYQRVGKQRHSVRMRRNCSTSHQRMAVFWTILLLSADAMPILQHLEVEKIGDSDRFEVEEKTSSWAMLGTHLLSGYPGRYFQRCQGLNATDGGEIIAVHGSCGADVDWVWLNARSLQQPCVVGTTLPVLHGRLLGNEHSVSQALGSQVEDNAQVEQHWPADPNLHVDEEDELRTCLSNWIDTTPQGLHLIMYGLYQRSIGTRRTTALVDIIDIQLQAAEAWIDILQQGTTAVLHLVRPQEYIANQELHVVIEFYSRDVPRPVVDIPIVRKTIWYGVWEGNEPEADYLTSGVTVPHALLQCGLREWCGPDLRTTCNLHVEKQIAVPHRPVLYRISIVEIYVHINEVENHDGGISLRQIQASRRSSIPHVNDRCCGLYGLCLAGHNDTLQLLQEDCSMLVSGPPSMAFRPNPQLQQRFDDIIPVAHQNREGQVVHQRIMPPPHWDSSPWYHSAVASGACHRNDGQLVVHIRSWLVRHGGPREPHARDFAMRPIACEASHCHPSCVA